MNICIIVLSCTLPVRKPLSYNSIRSLFSYEERVAQLISTLSSIEERAPSAKIVLIEGGLRDIQSSLPASITYHYIGSNAIVRWAVDSPFKGLGEAVLLLFAILKCGFDKNIDLFFKVSARYVLTKKFCIDSWVTDRISFLFRGDSVSTRCYAVPCKLIKVLLFALLRSLPCLMRGESIESVLPRYISNDHLVARKFIGISGFVAPDGDFIRE